VKYRGNSGPVARRISTASFAILITLLFSSCINVVQYIGTTSDRRTEVSVTATFNKAFHSLIVSESTDQSLDPLQIFASLDQRIHTAAGSLPSGALVESRKVDDQSQLGYQYKFIYPRDTEGQLRGQKIFPAAFFPVKDNGTVTLDFSDISPTAAVQESSTETNYAKIFLASAEYQLIVSKSYFPHISEALFVSDQERLRMTVTDLNDVYLLEMPLVDLIAGDGSKKIIIR